MRASRSCNVRADPPRYKDPEMNSSKGNPPTLVIGIDFGTTYAHPQVPLTLYPHYLLTLSFVKLLRCCLVAVWQTGKHTSCDGLAYGQ
jgi:hypothetical protein